MNKSNLLAILAFVLLAAAAGFLLLEQSSEQKTLTDADAAFAFKDTASIDSIFFAQKSGERLLLTRKGNEWWMNKRTMADKSLMYVLLRTIRDISVRREIPESEKTEIIKLISSQHTKVEIYAAGQKVKSYFIGDDADDNQGSYALIEGAEQPYVTHLPGFTGILGPRYNVTEIAWRDKRIFRTSKDLLETIEVKYPLTPASDFTLVNDGNGALSLASVLKEQTDAKLLDRYVQFVSETYAEQLFEEAAQETIDSLNKITPQVIISLRNKAKVNNEVLIVYTSKDIDRCVFYLGKEKLYGTIQTQVLQKLLARKENFITGSNPSNKKATL